jgi:hypothetical protein
MKYIAPIAVIGILLLQFSGAVPQASVGGAMTLALGYCIAAVAVGIQEAWVKGRGVLGWLLSIVVAFIGGILIGGMIGSFVLDLVMTLVSFEGSLAASGHPLLYVMLAVQMLFVTFGAWLALRLVDRWR